MKTFGQLALILILAFMGSQAGYPIFGWFYVVMTVLILLWLSWKRHNQKIVTAVEVVVIAVSAIVSVAISNSQLGVELGITLRLASLCVITIGTWLFVPNNIKEHWQLFK